MPYEFWGKRKVQRVTSYQFCGTRAFLMQRLGNLGFTLFSKLKTNSKFDSA